MFLFKDSEAAYEGITVLRIMNIEQTLARHYPFTSSK